MQSSKNELINNAKQGDLKNLLEDAGEQLANEEADTITIASINKGDEFYIKGIKFKITKQMRRGKIVAKMIGYKK